MDLLNTKPDTGDKGNSPGGVTLPDRSAEEKRGRGRPKGSGGKVESSPVSNRPEGVDKELIDELFKAEMWSEVASIPFNIRKVMTGSEVFSLTQLQKKILGTSLSATLKQFGIIDPKYAALAVLLANFSTIAIEMEIRYRAGLPKKKDKAESDNAVKQADEVRPSGIFGGGFNV